MAVLILQNFDGYPEAVDKGDGTAEPGPRRTFYKGQTCRDLTPEYEALLVAKGLAAPKEPAPEPNP